MSNRHESEVRTIHPRALAELGEEACIVALGVARDLRSGVIPPEEFNMGNYCGTACCIAGHITYRMWGIEPDNSHLISAIGNRQYERWETMCARSRGLNNLFASYQESDPQLAAEAAERYIYLGSETPWKA